MIKIKQLINQSSKIIPQMTDRELATVAIVFTFAYILDFIISNIRHIPPSLKSIFIIWYALLSLRFPKLYIITLALGTIFFILALLMSFFNFSLVINNFFQIGFFMIVIAFIQIVLCVKDSRQATR